MDVSFAGDDLVLRLASLAYLARFSIVSRVHTRSDLRLYFSWCTERELNPLAVTRTEVEHYSMWMRETRHFKPATIARRLAVVAGFYRPCVIDGLLDHSPAEYVRRPRVSNESPTLGLSHLQFEALLVASRDSDNPPDFALVAMLGLLGLRISEACRCDVTDLGEEHGHRVLHVLGRGSKIALIPLPPAGRRMDRHCATRRLRRLADVSVVRLPRMHPHMLRHTFVTTMLDAGVDLRDVQIAARHADPRTTMRYDRARTNLDRHPNYILAAFMASAT
ncbi:integrase [Nocardia yunnanensis]|uniref:Integrase n=1 Tax=Nocardia yunnanensis TaxID=2382165 RepID=A0A386ZQG7_9NOCA|nr:integrase [Nocardia yunnanensis]